MASSKAEPKIQEIDTNKNIGSLISPCCNAFVISGIVTQCSRCKREITVDDEFTTMLVVPIDLQDENSSRQGSSSSLLDIAKRFSTDPTYELVANKCPKCSSLSRVFKGPLEQLMFVCINKECRNVFSK